jgi:hypothetical protein
MSGYVTLPGDWAASQASAWIDRALAYVASLPPKAPKAPKPPRAAKPRARS